MKRIDTRSPIPMYFQLKEILSEYILEKSLHKGDILPSIRDLIVKYNVSLPVVRQALIELQKEGIINIEKGKGSYIAKIPSRPDIIKTKNILFLLCGRDFLDPYFSKVLAGVESEANLNGFSIIYNSLNNHSHFSHALERSDLTGIILTGEVTIDIVNKTKAGKIPFVLAGDMAQEGLPPKDINTIANNDREGAYLATKYLIELGHKKVAMFTWFRWMYCWKERYSGYEKALHEAGFSIREDYIIECQADTSEEAYKAMRKLLEKSDPPTAIFAGNDRYAKGAYHSLNKNGLKVPDDFSIIGFDDLAFAKDLIPPLTTIRANMEEIGRLSFGNLLKQIDDPDTKPAREILPATIIERSSCKNV